MNFPEKSCIFIISIHAPREGGDRDFKNMDKRVVISIHAPREGGDHIGQNGGNNQLISIHAPREGGDEALPVIQPEPIYFNPRPPRGGRHVTDKRVAVC